jgi:hypothetical protein
VLEEAGLLKAVLVPKIVQDIQPDIPGLKRKALKIEINVLLNHHIKVFQTVAESQAMKKAKTQNK